MVTSSSGVRSIRRSCGPVRREALTPDQEEDLRAIYGYLAPFLDISLEEFRDGFLRDEHPETEISVWGRIAVLHERFCEDNEDLVDAGRDVLTCLLTFSCGAGRPSGVSDVLWKRFGEFVGE